MAQLWFREFYLELTNGARIQVEPWLFFKKKLPRPASHPMLSCLAVSFLFCAYQLDPTVSNRDVFALDFGGSRLGVGRSFPDRVSRWWSRGDPACLSITILMPPPHISWALAPLDLCCFPWTSTMTAPTLLCRILKSNIFTTKLRQRSVFFCAGLSMDDRHS